MFTISISDFVCALGTDLVAKTFTDTSNIGGETGMTPPMIAAR
jgi:hypothetical protein